MLKKFLLIGLPLIFVISAILTWNQFNMPPSNLVAPTGPSALPSTLKVTPQIIEQPKEVTIISTPQGASISIDGKAVGEAPLKYTFPAIKEYRIEAKKMGYITLVLKYTPTDTSLRLQLASEALVVTPTISIGNSTPTPRIFSTSSPIQTSTPMATAVPFPNPPSLQIISQPNSTFFYNVPSTSSTPSNTSSPQISPSPIPTPNVATTVPTASSTNAQATIPNQAQIAHYQRLIATYSGIHDYGPDDLIEEGTANEEGIVISGNHFYPASTMVASAYPLRFINDSGDSCTLTASGSRGEFHVGSLNARENLLFSAAIGTDEGIQFWCAEKPLIKTTVVFLP
ncbi:MAG: PEGA domain-containing protein [Candidatus Abawacabacteria bacterium]|nr:PEGA domain-containing protein [Candidatus Abawacabacteria bacterium]